MKLFTKEIDTKLFEQYLTGSDLENQMVVAKIFNPYGRGTWYLLNSDPEDPEYLWAIVDMDDIEVGSVNRSDLENIRIKPFMLGLERDLSFRQMNALELYEGLNEGKKYVKGGGVENWIGSYKKPIKTFNVSEFLNSTKNDGHKYSLWNKDVGVTYAYNGKLYANNGQQLPNGTEINLGEVMSYWETKKIDTLLLEDEKLVVLPEKQDKYNCYTTGYDGMTNKYGNENNITLEEAVDFCWRYDDVQKKYGTIKDLEKEIMSIPYGKNNVIASTGNITGVVVYKLANKQYAEGGSVEAENKEMVLNNNKQIAHHTKELQSALKGKNVPAWVVAKVNRSATDLSDATHYMEGQGESYADGGGVGDKKMYEITFEDVFSFATAVKTAQLTDSQYQKAIQQMKNKDVVVDKFNERQGIREQLRIKEITPKFKTGNGVGDFKMVSFPEDKTYKYYVVDEDKYNYLTVQEDMFDKWKNANKFDKAEYYSEWIPKNEMVEIMKTGGEVKYYNKENEYRLGRPSGSIEKEILDKVTFKNAISEQYFVGSFGWKTTQGKLGDGYLYNLDEFDQNLTKDLKLKSDEKVFRYVNRTTAIGGITPFIKINIEKALLYFPIYNDNEDILFETKGVKPLWINIIQDKMKTGGKLTGWKHRKK